MLSVYMCTVLRDTHRQMAFLIPSAQQSRYRESASIREIVRLFARWLKPTPGLDDQKSTLEGVRDEDVLQKVAEYLGLSLAEYICLSKIAGALACNRDNLCKH